MNRFENDTNPLSGGLVLMVIAIMLCSVLSAGITIFAAPVEGELDSSTSFAVAKASSDWVKVGESDSSGQYGGSPTTSTSYTDSVYYTHLTLPTICSV